VSSQPHLQAVSDDGRGEARLPDAAPSLPLSDVDSDSTSGGSRPPIGGARGPQKQRPDRSLPTDRLSFEKQVEVLRSIAQLSGSNRRPVTAEALSNAIGLKGNTGGLSNKFFMDSGWVDFAGRGNYTAAEPLLEFHRALNFEPENHHGARQHLQDPVRGSWYWAEVHPLLEGGSVKESVVLYELSKAAGAADRRPQLLLILQWLEWVGLVQRDGEMVSLPTSPSSEVPDSETSVDEAAGTVDSSSNQRDVGESRPSEKVADATAQSPAGVDPSALVSFNFSVRITADDAAKMSNENLRSLLEFAEKLRGH
jgi:hypothetical protein